MREATRQRILVDLEVVPWRLRVAREPGAAREPTAPTGVPSDEATVPPAPRQAREPAAKAVTEPAPEAAPKPAPGRPAPGPVAPSPEPLLDAPEAGLGIEPIAVVSLVLGNVLLVLRADATRRERRLAGDLLAAAAGIWGRRPLTRRFDWPAAGDPPAQARTAARALRAFVGKDVQDHGTALLIYPEALAGMLQGAVSECRHLEIPELASLGRDAAAKRTLWRTLAGNP